MLLFIISRLLLLALLLPETEENRNRETQSSSGDDGSVQFGEFCLRLPDDSHWSNAEPSTGPSTDPAQPTEWPIEDPVEGPTEEPIGPTAEFPIEVQPVEIIGRVMGFPFKDFTEDFFDYPVDLHSEPEEPITGEPITSLDWPIDSPVEEPITEQLIVPDTQPLPIRSVPPNGKPTKKDKSGRTINRCRCKKKSIEQPRESTVRSVVTWYPNETCRFTQSIATLKDGSTVCVHSVRLLPIVETFLGWISPEAEPTTVRTTTEPSTIPQPAATNNEPRVEAFCGGCESDMSNMDAVNAKDVLFLQVEPQPLPCLAHIYVNLKDERIFCSHLIKVKTILQELENSPPDVQDVDDLPKLSFDGCRCRMIGIDPPHDATPVQSSRIWPPSENCAMTEIIETLINGFEVCHYAANLVQYLQELEHEEHRRHQMAIPLPEAPNFVRVSESQKRVVDDPPVCVHCLLTENWNSIERSSFQSLEMNLHGHGCSATILVTLKDGNLFCVDSTMPGFRDLLQF